MSIFSKNENEQKNFGKITADKAADIIKTLSGGEVKHTKKLVDNVVVFTGAAGGTGVSTLVSNVAYMATKKSMRVIVIDLNIMYPAQHTYFGKKEQELKKPDLVEFLTGKCSMGEAIENNGNVSLMYANNRGLMDSLVCEHDTAINNFNMAMSRLKQLYDLIIIDCPLKVEHTLCNTAFYICDVIYTVWDEGIGCIANMERIRRNMAVSGIEAYTKTKAILNKRTGIHYNTYPFDKLNMELVGVLPFEQDIIDASLRSQVFCDKGASSSKNASAFYHGVSDLTNKILAHGGYVG